MPNERTKPLDEKQRGDYSGPKARTLRNGFTIRTTALSATNQAAVVNAAIIHNAKLGMTFTASDVFQWQENEEGEGRKTLKDVRDHLESLVGKGFLVGVCDCSYRVVEEALI